MQQIEQRKVADLIPYARNARTHNDEQVAQIAASIREFGWTNPILVDGDNGIIAGHGRLLAARKLGLDVVPVIELAHLSESQRKAYILADNKLALNAGWDNELLALELGELQADGFDLSLAGFGDDELAGLLDTGTAGLTDPDDVPDPPAEPVTKPGDVWVMGRHRLMCGDSTDALAVGKLMCGALADMCFTSPPYAQQRVYASGGVGDWDSLMQGVFSILPVKGDCQILVNLGLVHKDGEWAPYWESWIEWMRASGWRRFGWYVWDQGPGLPGDWNGRLAPSHEFIFHFNAHGNTSRARKTKETKHSGELSHGKGLRGKDGTVTEYSGKGAPVSPLKIPDSVIRVMRHKARGIECKHPAVFPIDLPGEMINTFSPPDGVVYEPFCGSGTQVIAAQKNGRFCYAMELSPTYVDVAVERWQNFTGQQAVLEGDGRTFNEVRDGDRAQEV